MAKLKDSIFFLLSSWVLCTPLAASQDRSFGLGGTTSGRVSGVTAENDNAFAALYNPALIASQDRPVFGFSTTAVASRHGSLKGVLVDSAEFRTERGEARTEDYKVPDTQATLWAAGITYPFSLPSFLSRRAGIGFAFSGPYQKLKSFQSSTPYDFYTLHYGRSDSQFKGTIGLSVELWPERLYLGGGLSLFMSSAGAADASFFTENPTGRFNFDVGLNTAAVAGLYYRHEALGAGLAYRQEVNPTLTQAFDGKVQLGGTDTFHQPFVMQTTMYFEPASMEADVQRDFGIFKASAGVSYQWWTAYRPAILQLTGPDADGRVHRTQMPPLSLRNTWNPRASVEIPAFRRKLVVAVGYQYRPTPIPDLNGAHNLLDANTHVGGLSVTHRLGATEWFPVPVTLGLYGQYHWIEKRRIEKSNPGFIGAPGYDFSGNAYTYGLSVLAEL